MTQQGRSTAHVSVLIEEKGKAPRYVTWKGPNKRSIMAAARRAYPDAKLGFGNVWYTTSYGAHENPIDAPSNTELLIGGAASVALVGFGIYLAFKSQGTVLDPSTTLGDTSSLAALAFVV